MVKKLDAKEVLKVFKLWKETPLITQRNNILREEEKVMLSVSVRNANKFGCTG